MRRSGSTSATHREIRDRLGIAGIGERRAIDAAASVVEGERLEAVAAAIWEWRGWIVVASAARLLLVRRSRLAGSGRDEQFEWAGLTAVRSRALDLELVFGERVLKLRGLTPEKQADKLLAVARSHLVGDAEQPTGTDAQPIAGTDVRRIAQEEMGAIEALRYAQAIDDLAARLEPGEHVERVAPATSGFGGLFVITARRVLLIDVAPEVGCDRTWSLARREIRGAERVGELLRIDLHDRALALGGIAPAARLADLAALLRVTARDGDPPHADRVEWSAGGDGAAEPPVPAEPATPLAPLWSLRDGAHVTVRPGVSGAYEVSSGTVTVARISRLSINPAERTGFAYALAESSQHSWWLSCRRQRTGWVGVVESPDAAAPLAGYHPSASGGGWISFADRSYGLRPLRLLRGWRLSNDDGRALATIRVKASEWQVDAIDAEAHAPDGRGPELGVLLIAVWVLLLEHDWI